VFTLLACSNIRRGRRGSINATAACPDFALSYAILFI